MGSEMCIRDRLSTLPPGNSHSPPWCLCAGRRCINQRPFPSLSARATTQVHVGIFSKTFAALNPFLTRSAVLTDCQLRQVTNGATNMVEFLRNLGRDTRGATAVEYGLILALIFLAMIGGIQAFGTTATAMWTSIEAAVVAVTSG